MKTFRKLVRRRVEAAFRVRVRPSPPPRPRMDAPQTHVPPEIIDLATGPFRARFPDLTPDRDE